MLNTVLPARVLAVITLTTILCSLPLRSSCLSVPFPIGDDIQQCLFNSFETTLKTEFDIDSFDRATPGTVKAEAIEFRIRRNRPLIGIPPQLPKPKFKKERLTYRASITGNGSICISCDAAVYNKRDKRWYPVRSDGLIEQQILQRVVSRLLEGRICWVLGTLPGTSDHTPAVLNGATRVQIESALIVQQDIKTFQLNLVTPDKQVFTYPIPFVGDTSSMFSILEHILNRFAWEDPLEQVPARYSFFNAYARHGELMEGMVPAQVLVALGKPTRVSETTPDETIWQYPASSGYERLLFQNGELVLPR